MSNNPERPLILISNDDGVQAQGIEVLTRIMRRLGDVVVLAPDGARSGFACAISTGKPVRLTTVSEEPGLKVYACTGTPSDCVKLAMEKILPRRPDLMVSGINHGDNVSVSVHYSGTVGAVLEACMKGVPAIGYSLQTHDKVCDFTPYEQTILDVAAHVLKNGLPQDVCLNVNFPQVERLKGVCVCRQARGNWVEEWIEDTAPDSFRLAGYFVNLEPEAEDTDAWAVEHGMAAITPLKLDMTDLRTMKELNKEEMKFNC